MNKRAILRHLLFALLVFLPFTHAFAQTTRPYYLGFSDYTHDSVVPPVSYADAQKSIDETWRTIALYGDMVVIHEEESVPWTEALANRPDLYHPYYLDYIRGRAARRWGMTPNHKVFLYINVMNLSRTGIAGYRGAGEAQPLPPPFDGLKTKFSDPRVIQAFVNHASFMIDTFKPSYFAYGIEVNSMLKRIFEGKAPPEAWQEFVVGANYIYLLLKQKYPSLPVFASFQVDEFNEDRVRQSDSLKWLMPATDYISISSYAYGHKNPKDIFGNNYRAFNIPADYFTAIRNLAPSKKIAFAETGWPAEPIDSKIYSNEYEQQVYLNRLIQECETNKAEFINWFVIRDYDLAWQKEFQYYPDAHIRRVWRDNGILDGTGKPRWSFWTWNAKKNLPRN